MNTPYFVFVGIFSVALAVALLALGFLARLLRLGIQHRGNPPRRALALRRAAARRSEAANRRIHYRPTGLAAIRERCGAFRARKDSARWKVNSRKIIKKMVQNWRADYQRV
jgi:hypothetical protein